LAALASKKNKKGEIEMAKNDYLSHHGIPEQKWGVRRYQNYDGTLTEEGRRRLGIGKYEDDHDSDITLKKRNQSIQSGSNSTVQRI